MAQASARGQSVRTTASAATDRLTGAETARLPPCREMAGCRDVSSRLPTAGWAHHRRGKSVRSSRIHRSIERVLRMRPIIQALRQGEGVVWQVGQAQQGRSLRAETKRFLIVRPVLHHRADRLFIPSACLLLVTQLPMGHGQVEPVDCASAGGPLHGRTDRLDGSLPVPRGIPPCPTCSRMQPRSALARRRLVRA